jgi:signal transduction histidine kinase
MRRIPIRWRLTLFFTFTLTTITLALIVAMFAVQGVMQMDQLESRVRECAWAGESLYRNEGQLSPDAALMRGCDGATIAAVDGEGAILSQVGFAGEPGSTHPDRIWQDVLRTGTMHTLDPRSARDGDVSRVIVAVPVDDAASEARVVIASMPASMIGQDRLWIVPVIIAGLGIVVLIAMSIVSWLLVRSSLAPVATITDAAREITASDLSRRLPVDNARDELGQLSATINDLLARLEIAFNERERAMEDQRRFVADASHELRTPLTSILGYARMLRAWGLDNPDAAREGISAIEDEAERMHVLVESLLRLARGEDLPAIHPEPLDLVALAHDAVQSLHAAEPDAAVTVHAPDEPVMVSADRMTVRQVMGILLDNAIRYGASDEPVEVTIREERNNAVIAVTDHGPGIDERHLPHIFDRFYRADAARTEPGSGLGLAIAKQVLDQHGGSIDVDSEVGQGTTFTVTLPLSPQ